MAIQPITRAEEAKLPTFRTHREARLFFRARYGSAFQIEDSFMAGEGADATVVYIYSLVLDKHEFEEGRRRLIEGALGDDGAERFLRSYQTIEIGFAGSVHVVH